MTALKPGDRVEHRSDGSRGTVTKIVAMLHQRDENDVNVYVRYDAGGAIYPAGPGSLTRVVTIADVDFVEREFGCMKVMAALSDDSTVELFSYFTDEHSYRTGQFVGLTVDEARTMHGRADVGYLQS
jgi:hypothetical protein